VEENMAVEKVHSDGQIALPLEIQRAVGIGPGDLVNIDVTASGTVEIRRLPTLTLAEALQRYRIDDPIDDATDWEDWQESAARDVLGSDERG
jgi:AbrB family looped-hinge helix DNA binding protein